MSSKTLIYIGMTIGSYIGGSLPLFWGASSFSFESIIFGAMGGILGIWLGYKMGQYIS